MCSIIDSALALTEGPSSPALHEIARAHKIIKGGGESIGEQNYTVAGHEPAESLLLLHDVSAL